MLATTGFALPLTLAAQAAATRSAYRAAPGVPYTAEQINALLPPSVYFQGQSAALQLRNAGGVTFANGEILWASLVDTSGYSTGVQDRYQFYLVTEGPIQFGDAKLPAGAYGAGFVGDHFLLMDLGGHTVAQGPLQQDAAFARPRPLQVLRDTPNSVKLYLGRHWVLLSADPSAAPPK